MTARLWLHPDVFRDLDEHMAYIAQDNPDAALRFLDVVRRTFDQIVQFPLAGPFHQASRPKATGVRKRMVHGFHEYMVLYRTLPGSIVQVLRIAHRARDFGALIDHGA